MAEEPARAGAAWPLGTGLAFGPPAVSNELFGAALLAALEQRFPEGLVPPREPRAITHPNGFVKLPLAWTSDGATRLFLHVWRADSADADVHDHRWSFSSLVLRGELFHTLTEVTAVCDSSGVSGSRSVEGDGKRVGKGLPLVRYRLVGGKHCFDATYGERAVVDRRRTHVLSADQHYGMDAFTFHRAHALAGAMTLVARGLPQRPYSRVLIDPGSPPPVVRPCHRLDHDERRHHLREALEVLR
ncbi:hypothetical protein [Streptomyces longispororuber]|nr:hypothetical protein [Streptomyces longispororuber]